MIRCILAALLSMGCDSTVTTGDTGLDTAADNVADTSADSGADTPDLADTSGDPSTEPVPGTVALGCYELEIGVNVDAGTLESMVRWYGSFYLAEEDTVVTNVEVTTLQFDIDGTVRTVVDPSVSFGPLDELPELQERVRGWIEPTATEISDCVSSGPNLSRGHYTDTVEITMTGTSDQGDWSADCSLSQEGFIRTCHSGVSLMGDGSAFCDEFPDPPTWWTDISVHVYAVEGTDLSEVTVSSAILRGEGAIETFDFTSTAYAHESAGVSDLFGMYSMQEGRLPEQLCPDIATGYPPELYVTYEGTTPSGSFAGAAPAGQCGYGEI